MAKTCSTCGREVSSATEFACPQCTKTKIVRCESCRMGKNPYVCSECGFQGP